jgi:hypothetical protein
MMAAVFIMQPIGQLVAWAVGMAALQGLRRDYNLDVGVLTTNPDEIDDAKIGIDIFWRIVVGVGAVPAMIAILFRWTIPESGRYTYDVKQDARTALKDTRKVYEQQTAMQSQATELSDFTLEEGVPRIHAGHSGRDLMPQLTGTTSAPDASFDEFGRSSLGSNDDNMWEIPNPDNDDEEYNQFSYAELHTYFIKEGNWRYLAGTSLAWLLLDFAFVSFRTTTTTTTTSPTSTPLIRPTVRPRLQQPRHNGQTLDPQLPTQPPLHAFLAPQLPLRRNRHHPPSPASQRQKHHSHHQRRQHPRRNRHNLSHQPHRPPSRPDNLFRSAGPRPADPRHLVSLPLPHALALGPRGVLRGDTIRLRVWSKYTYFHPPRRNLPDALPLFGLRYCCRVWKTRLGFCTACVLVLRQRRDQRSELDGSGEDYFHVCSLYAGWGCD